MLCSVCKKNMAVIFINKLDKDGKNTGEPTGLCMECAKKQGINPMKNIMEEMEKISPEELENMTKQFDSMLGSFGISGEELDDTLDIEDDNDSKPGFNFSNDIFPLLELVPDATSFVHPSSEYNLKVHPAKAVPLLSVFFNAIFPLSTSAEILNVDGST